MTSPGQTYVISVLLEPIITELGLSRSTVSILYAIGTVVGGLALPLLGRLIDQQGARKMVLIIAPIAGIACIYMAAVQNMIMLTIGFILLRLFTHGGLTLSSQNVINQWWIRRRGSIMGISGVAWALIGFGLFPPAIHWLINLYGWRTSFVIQGMVLLLIMIPVGLFLFREQPEKYGLYPDGMAPSQSSDGVESLEENWTVAQAIRTVAFWTVTMAITINGMLVTGLFFHITSIFQDNGLSAGLAASVYVPIALTMALVNLGGGPLADRIPARFLMSLALLLMVVALFIVRYLNGTPSAILYGVVIGTSIGLAVVVQNVIWANYFGRQNLGSITSIATTVLLIGTAIGPIPLGFARDILGSYNQARSASTSSADRRGDAYLIC